MKYRYEIFEANERGKCPCCGETTELFYMSEQRKYTNQITKKISLTANKCKSYEMVCYDCQKKAQRQ